MADAITALGHALNNDLEQMRSISQNLANITTQGYKREVPVTQQFSEVLGQGQISESSSGRLPVIDIQRDMQQGTLKFTGSAFDLAIKGKGFILVKTEQGEALTRKGQTRIDEQGRLALVTGEVVMGESGEVFLANEPFSIDDKGIVTQGDEAINRISIVDVKDYANLQYNGKGFFSVVGGGSLDKTAVNSASAALMQGYTETSNVNTMEEMVRMIEISRHFETTHQVLRGYDTMLDNAINVLGDL